MYNTVSGNAVSISGKTIQNLFERFDLKGDGVIDLEEYKESVMKDAELIKWFEFLNRGVSNPLNLDAPNIDNDAGKPKFLTSAERLEGKITKIIRILEGSNESDHSGETATSLASYFQHEEAQWQQELENTLINHNPPDNI